jgi:hypothetical protein
VNSTVDKEELNCCFKTNSRMDFGGFTNKIKASAEAAAVAARSFKGFDDMADKDEYIHSDHNNVKRERRKPAQLKSSEVVAPSSRREREEGDIYSQTGTDTEFGVSSERSSGSSWSLLDRPRHDATPKNEEDNAAAATASKQSHPWYSAQITSSMHSLPEAGSNSQKKPHPAPQRQSTMPMLDVVADMLSSNNSSGARAAREKQTTRDESMSNSERNNREDDNASADSSENEFSDDDENDPILSMIRKKSPLPLSSRRGKEKPKSPIQKQTPKMHFLEMEDASPVPKQKQNIKKNSNRFMEELDQRMAMPEFDNNDDDDNMEAGLLSSSSAKEAPAQPSFWGMLNGGGRQQESSAAVPERKAAFFREDRRTQVKPAEESYAVVGSSSVLGEDEIRALAQMKESSTRQSSMGAVCLDRVRRHKRECFIVFTLLLGWVVYFYSRKMSVENDVHT